MSGVYVYCVTAPHEKGPELAGLGEAPVFLHPRPNLTLWMSAALRAPEPTLAAVRRHNHVVEAAWRSSEACVPFRFGQWFESSDAAWSALADREEALVGALERVRGASEFGVRVLEPAPSGPEDADEIGTEAAAEGLAGGEGTAYMESLRRRSAARSGRQVRGEEVRRRLRDALGAVVVDERSVEPRTSRALLELAHLVRKEDEARYGRVMDEVREKRTDLRFMVTGPWAPWSFGP